MQLLGDHPDRLLHVACGGADVGLYRPGVRVALMVGVDRVGEPTLLAHLLEEPAAHPAAEHVVEGRHRVAVLAFGRYSEGPEGDVILLGLLVPVVEAALRGPGVRLPDERLALR